MDSVTNFLQRENATLLDVRALFESVISKSLQLEESLGDHAPIIHSKTFKAALVEVQDGKVIKLDVDEVASTKCLQVTAATQDINEENEYTSDFAESILKKGNSKRKKLKASEETKDFIDTRFLLPTSNISERFFSSAGYAFNDYRQSLTPMNLEMQLFLKFNKKFWDIELVSRKCSEGNI